MAAANTHPLPAERKHEGRAGSRRIFPPQFKLQVLEAYRRDAQCRGNQRATARKFGIHRRQIQKWLQAEPALRAALLRRAPQPVASPPPYCAGSPESARQPTPPPTPPLTTVTAEPIDLSLRRSTPPTPEPPQKPVKLFRPYLLDDEPPRRVSAFSPVVGCSQAACSSVYWSLPAPAFPAPLR